MEASLESCRLDDLDQPVAQRPAAGALDDPAEDFAVGRLVERVTGAIGQVVSGDAAEEGAGRLFLLTLRRQAPARGGSEVVDRA